jgi:polyhydroxyalkanoate synthesis regulator phasin
MEAHTKTAEQIKIFVDQVDLKAQAINKNIVEFIDSQKDSYRKEFQEIKLQAGRASDEVKEVYEQRLDELKVSYENFTRAVLSFKQSHVDPLKTKLAQLRNQVEGSLHESEEKWEEWKVEVEELLETTKLAFQNFKNTFKER